jgi:Ca2+/H+ antiporter
MLAPGPSRPWLSSAPDMSAAAEGEGRPSGMCCKRILLVRVIVVLIVLYALFVWPVLKTNIEIITINGDILVSEERRGHVESNSDSTPSVVFSPSTDL